MPANAAADPYHVAIVIVGAGPTGLTAANLLGQEGIEALVLERQAGTGDVPRAITLDDEGLRICQAMGLYEAVKADMLLDMQAHYVSRGYFLARVEPTGRSNGHPFVSTLHQPTFEHALLHGLARFPCVNIRFQHTVTAIEQREHTVCLTIQDAKGICKQVTCDYLLACDGGKSMIRQWLGIPMHTLNGPFFVRNRKRHAQGSQRWLVVDGSEPDNNDSRKHITFFCTPARPAVTVPAPGQRRRWEFMLLPGEREQDMLHEQSLDHLLKQAVGQNRSVAHFNVTRQAVYTFHAMLAHEWMRERIFLLGDAAHLMPPFGGQGMNSGLRDAYNLCWKLALVLRRQAHVDLLATYPQERRPHVAQMIRFSAMLGALIMPTNTLIAGARDLFFRTINTVPALRHILSEARIKPQPHYRQGFLLSSKVRLGKHLVGTLLPQPHVTLPDGSRVLLDDVLGSHFALLRLTSTPLTAYAGLNAGVWQQWPVRFVCIVPRGQNISEGKMDGSPANPFIIYDDEGILSLKLRDNDALCLLVRPDRYIMGTFSMQQSQAFEQALTRLLNLTPHPETGDTIAAGV